MVEQLLEEGKNICIKPKGYSMYPLFVPGRDEVMITRANPEKIRRGDVVLYRREDGLLVIHRVWKRRGDEFYCVGDNQKEVEGPLAAYQIKGIMYAMRRKGKIFSVRHVIYRLYSTIWLGMRPIRPQISTWLHRYKETFFRKDSE